MMVGINSIINQVLSRYPGCPSSLINHARKFHPIPFPLLPGDYMEFAVLMFELGAIQVCMTQIYRREYSSEMLQARA